jgi:phosphoglycolate phosphatase
MRSGTKKTERYTEHWSGFPVLARSDKKNYGKETDVQLILFDCDGTLIDSQHLIVEAMGRTFAAHGMAAPPRAEIAHTIGLSVHECMRQLVPAGSDEVWDKLVMSYREHFNILRAAPGAAEEMFKGARHAVSVLAQRPDVLLGIATGKSRRGVQRFLEREGWTGMFATVQTADDAPSKPHPGMILNAMAETGARSGQTVMIGDTTHDILMANAAGVTGIGVAWGNHSEKALREAGAAGVARDFGELTNLISRPSRRAVA